MQSAFESLGFSVDEHYILIVTHKDRDHYHAHAVACRVSIYNGRAVDLEKYMRRG